MTKCANIDFYLHSECTHCSNQMNWIVNKSIFNIDMVELRDSECFKVHHHSEPFHEEILTMFILQVFTS